LGISDPEESVRTTEDGISERYLAVKDRIARACRRAGRNPEDVTVIGVTKTQPPAVASAAMETGIFDLGENYVQELVEKSRVVSSEARWHFIGHLQRNKVKYIAPLVAMIHGVDSIRLALEIDKQAERFGRTIPILLQVNTSGEKSKFGCPPEQASEIAGAILALKNIRLDGLMTLAAFLEDPEAVRPMFASLRRVRDGLAAELGAGLHHLSMGMTNDFEVAVEEGATLVRIGTALFGERG